MEVKTRDTEDGTVIEVETEEKVAVAVKTGDREIIYLPAVEGDDSSYYVEDPLHLSETENGYAVTHTGRIDSVEVIN